MKPEFSFQPVGTEIPFQQFSGGAPVIAGLSDRTGDSVLPFKSSDLLDTELFAGDLLHHHVNHPCAFGVFVTADHLTDQFSVLLILFIFSFPEETVIRLLQAAVIGGFGDSGCFQNECLCELLSGIGRHRVNQLAQLFAFCRLQGRNDVMQFLQRLLRFLFKGCHDTAQDSHCLFRLRAEARAMLLMAAEFISDSGFETDRKVLIIKFKQIKNVIDMHITQTVSVVIESFLQYKLFHGNLIHIRMIFILFNLCICIRTSSFACWRAILKTAL